MWLQTILVFFFSLYFKYWHLTGINILGSEIVLYHFKPKVKNLQRCLLFKTPVLQPFTLIVSFDTIRMSLIFNKKVTHKNCPALDKFLKRLDCTLNTITRTLALSQGVWGGVQKRMPGFMHLAARDLMGSERRYFKTMIWLTC